MPPEDEEPRASAVLMLFGEGPDGPDLLLTERSHTMRSHPGQVSFPGGSVDPGETAQRGRAAGGRGGDRARPDGGRGLRRAAAAVAAAEQLLGHPGAGLVARAERRARGRPPDEVHAVYRVPIAELRDPAHRITVTSPAGWRSPGFLIGAGQRRHLLGVHRRRDRPALRVPRLDRGPPRRARSRSCRPTCWSAAGSTRTSQPNTDFERAAPRMNLLDWLLVVLVVAYAVSGYWQGFVTGAFATAGLLLGGLFGVWLAPVALGDADPSLLVSLGALFIVILAASLGQGLLQWGGAKIRDRITWQPARALDAVGGAALSAARSCIVAWALGVAVSRLADRRGDADGAQLAGPLQGQRGAAAARRRAARRVQRRGRHQLLPALPRAVLARAHRRRGAGRPRGCSATPT